MKTDREQACCPVTGDGGTRWPSYSFTPLPPPLFGAHLERADLLRGTLEETKCGPPRQELSLDEAKSSARADGVRLVPTSSGRADGASDRLIAEGLELAAAQCPAVRSRRAPAAAGREKGEFCCS